MAEGQQDVAGLSLQEKRRLLSRLLTTKGGETLRRLLPAAAKPGLDLHAEVVLDPTIRLDNEPVAPAAEPRRILLAGATCFLGAFVLFELLQQTSADLYCLIRARTPEEGQQRIQRCLSSYGAWQERFRTRLIAVPGDLSRPLLGLAPRQFHTLADTIDVIYHSAAWVHFLYPYSVLKATNVLGTQDILRLAAQGAVKPVHYVSNLAVFSPDSYEGKVVYERDCLESSQGLSGGYAQSKWVAEKLVAKAQDRGLPVAIYRPGTITGHSQSGVWSPDEPLSKVLRGLIHIRQVPAIDLLVPDADLMMDMTPVDYASRAIVHLSRQPHQLGKAFHIVNPQPILWHELVTWLRSYGYDLRKATYDEWKAGLLKWSRRSQDHALVSLASFLPGGGSVQLMPILANRLQFDCQNTRDGLVGTSITCPPVDAALLSTYFSYFIRRGFVEPPSHGGQRH